MAQLNSLAAVDSDTGGDLFAVLASFGVLICMISTLVGIKFWWFKQRLTFNHSTTNNGAAGGAMPTVPLRTRRNREKRLSQQISEPVEVHGVFRRRRDDDMDIMPTKHLPPVRIRKLSQSTPSLFPLPPARRQDKVRRAIFEDYEPPTREPPRPPVNLPPPQVDSPYSSPGSPQPLTPAISLLEEMPTFEELEQKYRQMELNKNRVAGLKAKSTESIFRISDSPLQPLKRLNRNSYNGEQLVGMKKFVKAKSTYTEKERFQQKFTERRATGYLRPDEEHTNISIVEANSPLNETMRTPSVEEFGERCPTGYIKYEEIDVDGLEDIREKRDDLQSSLNAGSSAPVQMIDSQDYENYHGHKYDHINRASAQDLSTVTDGSPTAYTVDDSPEVNRANQQLNWKAKEYLANKRGTPESQESIDFTSDEEYADELDGVKRKTTWKFASIADCSFSDYKKDATVRSQTSKEPTSPISAETITKTSVKDKGNTAQAAVKEDTLELRLPTQPEQLWEELEANIKQDEREKRVWLEIENDLELNRDFVGNIDEEFDKIRHSYEENEASFLESTNTLKRVHEQVSLITPEPEGFGKSIDEDWESFEKLATVQVDQSVVQFNLSDLEDAYDSGTESTQHIECRPTAFVRNSVPFKRELSNIVDEDEPTSPHYNESRVELVEPIVSKLDENYVHEHNKDSIFEPVEESLTVLPTQARARPRPRQKVTFDFSSTEYYQAPHSHEEVTDPEEHDVVTSLPAKHVYSDSESADEEAVTQTWPKPMQRLTKIQHTAELHEHYTNNATESHSSRTPSPTLLPISVETDVNDSWATIKQRQDMIARTTTTITSRPISPTLLNLSAQPNPALRKRFAQSTTAKSVILLEESVVTQSQMSGFKPHAAVRQQYFEQSYCNSTEA